MFEVVLSPEVGEWFAALDDQDSERVASAIDALEQVGPTLGRPLVDRIKGSKIHALKELRPGSTSIRILFAFDPKRQAILLVAGNKAGQWKNWYSENIPVAEQRFADWAAGDMEAE